MSSGGSGHHKDDNDHPDAISAERFAEVELVKEQAIQAVVETMLVAGLRHPVGSWQNDPAQATVVNHLRHAFAHIASADAFETVGSDFLEEIDHAICRLAMARYFLIKGPDPVYEGAMRISGPTLEPLPTGVDLF